MEAVHLASVKSLQLMKATLVSSFFRVRGIVLSDCANSFPAQMRVQTVTRLL
jgi:hypothetical protein